MMAYFKLTKPSYLAAASLFADKSTYRPHYQGVSIESAPGGGVYISGTDGVRISVFYDRAGYTDKDCMIPVPRPLFAATRFQARHPHLKLEMEDGVLRVLDGENEVPRHMQPAALIDSGCLDWRRVLHGVNESDTPDKAVAYNAKYLADFSKVLDAAFGAKDAHIRLISNGNAPSLITTCHLDWFGILMPVRSDAGFSVPFPTSVEQEADDA